MSSDPIAVVKVLSSGQRSVTPSKLLLVRNATPQRATSNPRASSAKTRFALAQEAQLASEVSHRAPSRSASRRKQRRWENMHVFSSEVNDVLMRELDDEYSSMSIRKSRFEVDMRSAFKKLFEPGNAAALEAFRLCAEKVDYQQRPKHSKQSSVEQAWMNVEKKLRTILVQSILKNPDTLSFLAELESLVIHFKHSDDSVFSSTIDALLKESSAIDASLLQPPTVNEEGQLEIYFKDSAFHRLLLHCVSQFHRLTSKSFVSETGAKVTLVTKHKSTPSEEKEPLRLVNFLHDRALLGLRGRDSDRDDIHTTTARDTSSVSM